MTILRVTHRPSGSLLAEGPSGRGIALFEGNYYVRRKYLCITRRKEGSPPRPCVYSFLYAGLDLWLAGRAQTESTGKSRWLTHRLVPILAFRLAFPGDDPSIRFERLTLPDRGQEVW
ncbi:MAG: hypothetical protein ABI114_00920 [Rhodanobacter sp.]